MRKIWVLVAVAMLSGCITRAEFKPWSAVQANRPQIVEVATIAYQGDIDILNRAGAEMVGEFEVRGNAFASKGVLRDRALKEAALVGGTHVLIAREGETVTNEQIGPDTSSTHATATSSGNSTYVNSTTTHDDGTVRVKRHNGNFVVVRVPKERWPELPLGLRPIQGDSEAR